MEEANYYRREQIKLDFLAERGKTTEARLHWWQ